MIDEIKIISGSVGASSAFILDENRKCFGLGTNSQGELGLGNCEIKQQFVVIPELKDKKIEHISAGASGFVVCIGNLG